MAWRRNYAIYDANRRGETMADIAVRYGISPQRVWQIVDRERRLEAEGLRPEWPWQQVWTPERQYNETRQWAGE